MVVVQMHFISRRTPEEVCAAGVPSERPGSARSAIPALPQASQRSKHPERDNL